MIRRIRTHNTGSFQRQSVRHKADRSRRKRKHGALLRVHFGGIKPARSTAIPMDTVLGSPFRIGSRFFFSKEVFARNEKRRKEDQQPERKNSFHDANIISNKKHKASQSQSLQ